MCRNIRPLNNFAPPASDDEVHAAALQYVRKVSGATKPSKANEEAFERAVHDIAHATEHLLEALVSSAPPKNREVEAAKADDSTPTVEEVAARASRILDRIAGDLEQRDVELGVVGEHGQRGAGVDPARLGLGDLEPLGQSRSHAHVLTPPVCRPGGGRSSRAGRRR